MAKQNLSFPLVSYRFRVSQASLGQATPSVSYGFHGFRVSQATPRPSKTDLFPWFFMGLLSLRHPLAKQNLAFPMVFHRFMVSWLAGWLDGWLATRLGPGFPGKYFEKK